MKYHYFWPIVCLLLIQENPLSGQTKKKSSDKLDSRVAELAIKLVSLKEETRSYSDLAREVKVVDKLLTQILDSHADSKFARDLVAARKGLLGKELKEFKKLIRNIEIRELAETDLLECLAILTSLIDDPREKSRAVESVSIMFLENKKYDRAIEVLQGLDPKNRSSFITNTVADRFPQIAKEQEIMSVFSQRGDYGKILEALFRSNFDRGDLATAKDLVLQLKDDGFQEFELKKIVDGLILNNEIRKAIETAFELDQSTLLYGSPNIIGKITSRIKEPEIFKFLTERVESAGKLSQDRLLLEIANNATQEYQFEWLMKKVESNDGWYFIIDKNLILISCLKGTERFDRIHELFGELQPLDQVELAESIIQSLPKPRLKELAQKLLKNAGSEQAKTVLHLEFARRLRQEESVSEAKTEAQKAMSVLSKVEFSSPKVILDFRVAIELHQLGLIDEYKALMTAAKVVIANQQKSIQNTRKPNGKKLKPIVEDDPFGTNDPKPKKTLDPFDEPEPPNDPFNDDPALVSNSQLVEIGRSLVQNDLMADASELISTIASSSVQNDIVFEIIRRHVSKKQYKEAIRLSRDKYSLSDTLKLIATEEIIASPDILSYATELSTKFNDPTDHDYWLLDIAEKHFEINDFEKWAETISKVKDNESKYFFVTAEFLPDLEDKEQKLQVDFLEATLKVALRFDDLDYRLEVLVEIFSAYHRLKLREKAEPVFGLIKDVANERKKKEGDAFGIHYYRLLKSTPTNEILRIMPILEDQEEIDYAKLRLVEEWTLGFNQVKALETARQIETDYYKREALSWITKKFLVEKDFSLAKKYSGDANVRFNALRKMANRYGPQFNKSLLPFLKETVREFFPIEEVWSK